MPDPWAAQITIGELGDRTPEQVAAERAKHDDDAIIEQALKRFDRSDEAENLLRREMQIDRQYMASDQWPVAVKQMRDSDGRPCLTINRLPQFVNQVCNQERQARPAIQVSPVDSASDIDTAKIFQGIIRHIEVDSRADIAYDHACQDQVQIGRGWWQITADYLNDDSFQQDLKIKRVRNPFRIYPDPASEEPDYSDAVFLHDVIDMRKEEFESRFPDAADQHAAFDRGTQHPGWISPDIVRVSKYWRVVTEQIRTYQHADGSAITEDQLTQRTGITPEHDPEQVMRSGLLKGARTVTKRRVEWYLMTCAAILDRGEWPGRWIPYVPVLGAEIDLNGRTDLRGIIRDARDPQQRYNVQVSAETESIGLAPKAPFIGYKGQFTDPKWADANRRNYPYLESQLTDINGERVPLPQRQIYEPPVRAIAEAIRQADSDLRAVTGYYDQFPQESAGSERSGRAILARQRQGEVGNSHFMDNLARSITFTGKLLINLIPFYYDTFRIVRILGENDQPTPVGVYAGKDNQPHPSTPIPAGVEKVKDLSVGTYDVVAKMGKSYLTSRDEQVDALTALAQAAPQLVPMFADVWIKSQDWPGAQEIGERLTPPAAKKPDGEQPIPPQVQQQMQQLMQQHEQLTQALHAAKDMIEQKRMELESKERIARWQVDAQLEIALAQTQSSQAIAGLKHRTDLIELAIDQDAVNADREAAVIDAQTAQQTSDPSASAQGTPSLPTPSPTFAPAQAPVGPPGVPLGA